MQPKKWCTTLLRSRVVTIRKSTRWSLSLSNRILS
jgi:hypothetical protein